MQYEAADLLDPQLSKRISLIHNTSKIMSLNMIIGLHLCPWDVLIFTLRCAHIYDMFLMVIQNHRKNGILCRLIDNDIIQSI